MPPLKLLALLAALTLWATQTIAHGQGNAWAGAAFRFFGFQRGEQLCALAILIISTALLAALLVKALRNKDPEKRQHSRHLLALFTLLAVLALLAERFYVVLHSELYHYVQYGLIALLLAYAIPKPAAILLATSLLGAADEAYQQISYYAEKPEGAMDWNDTFLDTIGAAGGIWLACLINPDILKNQDKKPLLVASLLAIPGIITALLVLAPPPRPFWTVWIGDAGKPYHESLLAEGLAALSLLHISLVAAFSNPQLKRRWLITITTLLLASLPSLLVYLHAPAPLEPRLPETFIVKTTKPITIDGLLDDEAWRRARSIELRADRQGKPTPNACGTRVFLAWDDQNLYIAAQMRDQDIWADDKQRDDPTLPGDEVFEVFLDPTGQGQRYIEIEATPRGTLYDLIIDYDKSSKEPQPFTGDATWNPAIKIAAHINGTLTDRSGPIDGDQGWSIEIAIPFADLPTDMKPPKDGALWRGNFYRIERPRKNNDNGRQDVYACWSPSMNPSFHRPERMGRLFFSQKPGPLRDKP